MTDTLTGEELETATGGLAWIIPALAAAYRIWNSPVVRSARVLNGQAAALRPDVAQTPPPPATTEEPPDQRTYQPWNYPDYWR